MKNYLYSKDSIVRISAIIGLMVILSNGIAAPLNERTTTMLDQNEMAVTIYNQNLALIKDSRSIELDINSNQLAWREVSAKMQPETALLRNLTHPSGFYLQEQNFDFDLLTPQQLLKKHIGSNITVIHQNPATGHETSETATVLAANDGVVLKFSDRIETGIPGRLAFPSVPENLRDKPTLVTSFMNSTAGKQNLELSYLTTGLSWQADYVAELDVHDHHLDLNGLVTLTNESGTTYPNATLQLVAGDLNRIHYPRSIARKTRGMTAELANISDMQNEALFEYHLYTLKHRTTLADNQTKQVALMSAVHVPVNKEFVLTGDNYYYSGQYKDIGDKLKVTVFVKFQNQGKGLGIPLPKGVIRVYKKDQMGNAQFVGEDQIDHTPDKEFIRLKLGSAFDLTADKKQSDFQALTGTMHQNSIFETAYQITLKNAKKEEVAVTVHEPIPGDWTIISESQPHTKISSNLAEWKLLLPADKAITLTYRVRTKL